MNVNVSSDAPPLSACKRRLRVQLYNLWTWCFHFIQDSVFSVTHLQDKAPTVQEKQPLQVPGTDSTLQTTSTNCIYYLEQLK